MWVSGSGCHGSKFWLCLLLRWVTWSNSFSANPPSLSFFNSKKNSLMAPASQRYHRLDKAEHVESPSFLSEINDRCFKCYLWLLFLVKTSKRMCPLLPSWILSSLHVIYAIPLQHSTKCWITFVTSNVLHSVSALQLSSNLISQQPWKNYLKINIFLPCPPWS